MSIPMPVWLLTALLGGAFPVPPPPGVKPPCEPGYTLVEEIQYQQVVRKVCKMVPDVKKVRKTVYETKEEDFCLSKKPNTCGKPQTRKILIKKEIVEEVPTYRQVVESVVEVVPVKVYRKVPCPPPGAVPQPADAPRPVQLAPPVVPPKPPQ